MFYKSKTGVSSEKAFVWARVFQIEFSGNSVGREYETFSQFQAGVVNSHLYH